MTALAAAHILSFCATALCQGVDLEAVIRIESSGDANAISPAGARGLCQLMPDAWHDATGMLCVTWTFEEAFDPAKNRACGQAYLNRIIPNYLRRMRLPDTTEMRLAAYNAGIGRVGKIYRKHGRRWQEHLPAETQNYIARYERAVSKAK